MLSAILVKENGKVLLVRDSSGWRLPAEEVRRETFEEAAERCKKEVGCPIALGRKVGVFVDTTNEEIVVVFEGKLAGEPSEIATGWFSEDEILRMFSSGSIRKRWVPKAVRHAGAFNIYYA